ncbi:MAG: hypothetical protein L6N94_01430 [Candidatus Methylarchaceae archaeon HK01M]|nr:hypothetical protein [Candidatus Methylarchaceae archaeon HK01M]
MIHKKHARILSLLTYILLITFIMNAMIPVVLADPSYTVKTGTLLDSTSMTTQRSLVRSSNGTLHCVYSNFSSSLGFIYPYYAYSKDGGMTWNDELVADPDAAMVNGDQFWPCIAIDSNDNVHVVWAGFGWGVNFDFPNIQYRMRTPSGGWQAQEGITDVGILGQFLSAIAIDSKDNVHVVWEGNGWGVNLGITNIQYRMRTPSGGWQAQEGITDVDANQDMPSIAIDSKDNVHVVWAGPGWGVNTDDRNIQYRMRTADGWQAQEGLTDIDYDQFYPCMAIDSKDNVHLVWNGWGWGTYPDFSNIQYRMRTSNGWQAQEEVTDKDFDQDIASIAMDSKDNVHVVWDGLGCGNNPNVDNIQYRMRTSDGWQAREGLTDLPFAYGQNFPILIWAMHPTSSTVRTNVPESGYALVYSGQDEGGWKVVYLYSSDLKWGTKEAPVGDFTVPLLIGLGVAILAIVTGIIIVKRRKVIT